MLRFSAAASAAAAAVAALFLDIPQLRQLAVRGLHELLQPVLKVGGLLRGLADKAHGAGTAALAGGPSASAEPLLSSTLAGGARGRRRHLLDGQVDPSCLVNADDLDLDLLSLLQVIRNLSDAIQHKDDPETLERVAREKGYVKQNEVLFFDVAN